MDKFFGLFVALTGGLMLVLAGLMFCQAFAIH